MKRAFPIIMSSRIFPMITLIALLAAVVFAAQGIPFDPMQGIVQVDITIDGHAKGRFGIDTGADHLYVDRGWAAEHSLSVSGGQPMRSVQGIEGHSEARTMSIRSLEIGHERLYNVDAVAIDLGALIKDKRAAAPDGLIGYSILRRFYITIDYPKHSMLLEQAEPDFLKGKLPPSVPFKQENHLIMVDVTFNDSIIVPMALDYCATHVFLSPELAAQLKVNTADPKATVRKVSLGGVITSENVYVSSSDLGSLKSRLRGVQIEGLIGASFLYRHKITIDYRRNQIYLRN